MRRRKVTSETKIRPSVETVQQWQAGVRAIIAEGGYEPHEIFSGDETGICRCIDPTHQYTTVLQVRAAGLGGDVKARFTALLCGNAIGSMMPPFHIFETASKNSDDHTRSTILRNTFGKVPPFDGHQWESGLWDRQAMHKGPGDSEPRMHHFKYPFLRNKVTFEVIVVQEHAWMDSQRFGMWLDLQVTPYLATRKQKMLMIMDNHSSHDSPLVKGIAASIPGLRIVFLPPNMTDRLQVMDLVVNGPVKRFMRGHRVSQLFDKFQLWLDNRKRCSPGAVPTPWKPTIPSTVEGLAAFRTALESFDNDNFKGGMRRCFAAIGLVPSTTGHFIDYVSHEGCGTSQAFHGLEQVARATTAADIIADTGEWVEEWADDWTVDRRNEDGSADV